MIEQTIKTNTSFFSYHVIYMNTKNRAGEIQKRQNKNADDVMGIGQSPAY